MKPLSRSKVFLFTILLLTISTTQAQTIKRYSTKSAIINYQISGNGKMMGVDTHTSGKKSLYFKNYGAQSIEKTQQVIIQNETTWDERRTHTLKKIDNTTIYDVDYKQKKIVKSIDQIGKKYLSLGKNLSDYSLELLIDAGGKKVGTDKVLGLKCEIWDIEGTNQCLYENQIPLWIEADIMGVKHKTIATEIKFDINISDEEFELPKYSIEVLSKTALN